MDANFHFGPARIGELTAYGARMPDTSPTGIREWADFMRAQGVTRVCCLLDSGQLARFPVNLETAYKKLFGAPCGAEVFGALVGQQSSTGHSPFPSFARTSAANELGRA